MTFPDGSYKDIYGRSVPEVKAKVKAIQREADTGVLVDDHTTVGEWTAKWRDTDKANLRALTK